MIKLDKTKVYDLKPLSEEEREYVHNWLKVNDINYKNTSFSWFNKKIDKCDGFRFSDTYKEWLFSITSSINTNAKELFYTLENVQVDCRELSEEQIEDMKEAVVKNGYTLWDYKTAFELCNETRYFMKNNGDADFLLSTKSTDRYTITYEKFMKLFGDKTVASGNNQPPVYSVGSGMTTNKISLSIKPEGVVKFLANRGVFLSPEDYKKLFE